MASRIEQIIEEIEEFVDSCKFQPLSSTKIIVNKEELEELLRELRMRTPDEIKRYQKIISNKDAILEDAQQKADAIIADAQARADRIVSESEVMQKALEQSNQLLEQTNSQAQEMIDNATNDSNNIRMSAISYTDEMLENLEKIMNHTLDTSGQRYTNFINSIQSCLDVVTKNRSELAVSTSGAGYSSSSSASSDSPKITAPEDEDEDKDEEEQDS